MRIDPLVRLLTELKQEAPDIRSEFEDLFDTDLDCFPIPFFGNLRRAKVITVGLNPSDGEIRGRGWARPVDVQTIMARLSNYFINPQFPQHGWFNRWEQALGKIGVSYFDGTAAHIDLCPWPTRPMNKLDQSRFQRLVLRGLPSFWRCVQLAAQLRLVLMAGAMNKRYYLNEFLAKMSSSDEMFLAGRIPRNGRAFVGYHQLHVRRKEYPVFFCSVSPSARTGSMLPVRVAEHRERLRMFLEPNTPPNPSLLRKA